VVAAAFHKRDELAGPELRHRRRHPRRAWMATGEL
jgi:hypothetical protein